MSRRMGLCALLLCALWTGGMGCAEELIGEDVSHLFYLEREGAVMPVLVEGNTASKAIVVIVHGGPGGDASVYNEVIPHFSRPLEERYAVAYWDQRSSGQSRGTLSAPTLEMEQKAADLEAVVDLLHARFGQDQKIFLMAHSYGGLLSAYYLLDPTRQAKITGWLCVAGAYDYPLNDRETHRMLLEVSARQIEAGQSVEEWSAIQKAVSAVDVTRIDFDASVVLNQNAWRANSLAVSDGLADPSTPGRGIPGLLYYALFRDRTIASVSNLLQIVRGPFNDEITVLSTVERLGEITLPTAMMFGRYDFVVPPSLAEIAHQQSGAPPEDRYLHIYERSGHSPMDDDTEDFLADMFYFIDRYIQTPPATP